MNEGKHSILVIDDERNTREGLRLAFEDKYVMYLAEDAIRGLDLLQQHSEIEIVLTDYRMPGMDGMDFIKRVNSLQKRPLIIMLTAYGSVQTAIEAMKAGAYDYVSKPIDLDNLEMMIDRGLAKLSEESSRKGADNQLADVVAVSPAMQSLMESVAKVAPTKATVLLTGESGTGKEVIAHAIHRLSGRGKLPFVAVHCAALNENLLESELFGHEKGAYTGANERVPGRFETAQDGTLFLDEIGEISLPTQVKLLRVLENKTFERVGGKESIEVKARLIAATNRNLEKMVEDGTFREDLFYRLNVVSIDIPPLRKRKEEIPALLEFFLKRANTDNEKSIVGFAPEALELLKAYNWPGNVRELRNCVERMVVFAQKNVLTLGDVPQGIRQELGRQFEDASPREETVPSDLNIRDNERNLIIQALAECGGNRTHAAEKLSISRRTLQRKMHEYNIN